MELEVTMTKIAEAGPLEPMSEKPALDTSKVAYQLPQPTGMLTDIFIGNVLDLDGDERDWVPQSPDVSFKPIVLSVSQGYYVNILRVRSSGGPVPPPPQRPGARSDPARQVALPGARLGGDRRRLRLRAAGRNPHPGGARRCDGDGHVVPRHRRLHLR